MAVIRRQTGMIPDRYGGLGHLGPNLVGDPHRAGTGSLPGMGP